MAGVRPECVMEVHMGQWLHPEDFLWHVTTLTSPNIASGLIATIFVPVMPLHALHAGQAHLTIWLLRILWSVRSISEHGHCCDARV